MFSQDESKALDELSAVIIDEQRLIRDAIKHELFRSGVTYIRGAANAFEANQAFNQKKFDLVFISFNLSTDKDGFHLLEELKFKKHITHLTTVIFLSADTSNLLVNCVVEMQPDDFWTKPLESRKIRQRLQNILEERRVLNKPLLYADKGEYSKAIYYAERVIKEASAIKHRPKLYRLIGECICNLGKYPEAESFYQNLLQKYDFGWLHICHTSCQLKHKSLIELDDQVATLKDREDTRFLMHDLLVNHHIQLQNYEEAYEEIKIASSLAPRNIERNKRLRDLARINHDLDGQYLSTLNMLKYAKNSIHDSPELSLQVIRAGIDLANATDEMIRGELVRELDKRVIDIQSSEYGKALAMQINVLKARMKNLEGSKNQAESILNNLQSDCDDVSIEDSLDLMKAFHESGNRERSVKELQSIKLKFAESYSQNIVMQEYLEQELKERSSVHFTPKELLEMSAKYYKSKRYNPAYDCLKKALLLAPRNTTVALGLLKVLLVLKNTGYKFKNEDEKIIQNCESFLSAIELPSDKKAEFNEYVVALA